MLAFAPILTLSRISVLRDAATLGVLFRPSDRRDVNAAMAAGLVRARRPEPDRPGAWGRLTLTGRGVVELRCATAALAGKRLPARLRQLPLFDYEDIVSAHPNDGRPRGLQSLSDRARAAGRLVLVEGKSRAEVAAMYGVAKGTVQSWVEQYREHERDQRLVATLRRTP